MSFSFHSPFNKRLPLLSLIVAEETLELKHQQSCFCSQTKFLFNIWLIREEKKLKATNLLAELKKIDKPLTNNQTKEYRAYRKSFQSLSLTQLSCTEFLLQFD